MRIHRLPRAGLVTFAVLAGALLLGAPAGAQAAGPPAVVTGGVLSEVPGVAPSTTATVGGEVNPESLDTHYYVQYGTGAEEYTQSTPVPPGIDAGSGETPVVLGSEGAPPDISLEDLTPGAVYHYRLVASNEDGTTYGNPETVAVPPAPPLVGPASVSEITQRTATITTSINPEDLPTLYKLDVGTSTAYGTPYPGETSAGSTPVELTFDLTELEAGTTYHFRLIAADSDGTSSEPDQTFTTTAAAATLPPAFTVPPSPPLVPFTAQAFPTTPPTKQTTKKKTAKVHHAHKKKAKHHKTTTHPAKK
jgi:hypothetical protein